MELKNLDMMALMPCPLKVPFEKMVNQFVRDSGDSSAVEIVANANHHMIVEEKLYEMMTGTSTPESLPDIIISPGVNHFYYGKFKSKFITPGYFRERMGDSKKFFKDIGYMDPEGHYTMFAMNVLVLVVCTRNLGEAPVPREWADILEGDYRDKIVIRGRNSVFCETVLLNVFKEHGMPGILKLAENVNTGCHPSRMIKMIKDAKNTKTAIYTMPWFFARMLAGREGIEIVWPEDGALVNALTMLVKKESSPAASRLASYITGKAVGNIFENAGFPCANREVEDKLPRGKRLKWLGWDFINHYELETLIQRINKRFFEKFSRGR